MPRKTKGDFTRASTRLEQRERRSRHALLHHGQPDGRPGQQTRHPATGLSKPWAQKLAPRPRLSRPWNELGDALATLRKPSKQKPKQLRRVPMVPFHLPMVPRALSQGRVWHAQGRRSSDQGAARLLTKQYRADDSRPRSRAGCRKFTLTSTWLAWAQARPLRIARPPPRRRRRVCTPQPPAGLSPRFACRSPSHPKSPAPHP